MPYLDHNATGLVLPAVREAVAAAMVELPGNPHSQHRAGRAAAEAVDLAREQVARMLGRPARQVIFTSGASEANSQVLSGLGPAAGKAVVTSAVEHPSVMAWATHVVPVDDQGRVQIQALEALLQALGEKVGVVSVMAANNETGVLQPIDRVAACCRAAGVPYHCDASQLPGRLPVQVDADLVTLSGHKMGGPMGVGALVAATLPPPLVQGGPQERGHRAGTVPVPLVVGMGVAASLAGQQDPTLRDRLEAAAVALGGRPLSAGAARLPNTSALLFDEPGDLLVMALDLEGVAASTGSACSSGASKASHVVAAMGLQGVPLRLSLGPDTTDADIDRAIAALQNVLQRVRALDDTWEASA